jgi:hypothetical protein
MIATLLVGLASNNSQASLLTSAEEVLEQVSSQRIKSTYSHENKISHEGYHMNCYGFINHLVQQVSPEAYGTLCQRMLTMKEQVPVSTDGMPCPFNMFAIFQSLTRHMDKHWMYVPINELEPGDVLVYQPTKYTPPQTPDLTKRSGTHAMIVSRIVMVAERLRHFQVIDCTRDCHSADDLRPGGSGIGCSNLYIKHKPDKTYYRLSWEPEKIGQKKELAAARLIL